MAMIHTAVVSAIAIAATGSDGGGTGAGSLHVGVTTCTIRRSRRRDSGKGAALSGHSAHHLRVLHRCPE